MAATAVLPSASVAERGGTFTNHAGRVQRFRSGFPARGRRRTRSRSSYPSEPVGSRVGLRREESVFEAIAGTEASFAG